MRLRAGAEMIADVVHLDRLQGAHDEAGRQVANLVAAQAAHAGSPPSGPLPNIARRIWSRPRRIRLFTVPNGAFVRTAISYCVSPLK
jgi:hypothetical protein